MLSIYSSNNDVYNAEVRNLAGHIMYRQYSVGRWSRRVLHNVILFQNVAIETIAYDVSFFAVTI